MALLLASGTEQVMLQGKDFLVPFASSQEERNMIYV